MPLDLSSLPLFLAAATILLITPGPDMAFITAVGMTQGQRPAIMGAAGVGLSMFSHSVIAAAGLTAILAASSLAFDLVRIAGSAYLVFLAYKAFRSGTVMPGARPVSTGGLESFRQGFLTNLLNPKVILFTSLFLVQFASTGHGPAFVQVVSLGAVLALLAFAFFSALGTAAGTLGRFLMDSRACRAVLPRAYGTVFLLLAVRLLLVRQPS